MPAPTRLIGGVRPGTGYTTGEVIASTNLSEWVQPPDRETGGNTLYSWPDPPDARGRQSVGDEISFDTPIPEPAPPGSDLRDALAGAWNASPTSESGDSYRISGVHVNETSLFVAPGDDDPVHYHHHLRAGWFPGLRPFTCLSGANTIWQDAWRPEWPERAIGYEVEQYEVDAEWVAIAEPVKADVTVTLVENSIGGSFSGLETVVAFNSEFGENAPVVNVSGSGSSATVALGLRGKSPDRDDRVFDGSLALITKPHATGQPPETYEVTIDDFSAAPLHSGLFVAWTSMRPSGGAFFSSPDAWPMTGIVGFGHNPVWDVTYTIRPPRIRWIYPPRIEASPRRVFPRDDALTGGPRRVYPPPRSEQRGFRAGPGSYL